LPDLWKVEIARLLPEVAHLPSKVKVVSSAESPSSQVRMFEAVDRLIQWVCQGPHPGILFLDDLQWADNASVDLLIYLLQKSSVSRSLSWAPGAEKIFARVTVSEIYW
jgi:predicted ATPase